MIKGNGFGKLLKPLFSILSIGFFGFLGSSFVNSANVQMVGLDSLPSAYNNQYNLTFLKGGGVLTNYLGQGKSILALNSNIFFRRATNGLPYFYGPYSQGFFSTYCSCDEIINNDRTTQNANCTCNPVTGDVKELFKGFFSKVKQNDYAFYEVSQTYNNYPQCTQRRYDGKFCRSSAEIHSTICLAFQDQCYNTCGPANICNGLLGGGLVDSQGLTDLTFGLIHNDWIGPAPGQFGYNGTSDSNNNQGSVSIDSSNVSNITGDYSYMDCTYGAIIDYFERGGMSRNLCYGGLDNFDSYNPSDIYNPIPGSGKSLGQILAYASNTWDTPDEWFNFWNGLRGGYVDMWSSYPAVFKTWFDIYYQYGGDVFLFDTVREYCIMKDLNLSPDTVYHGNLSSSITARACRSIQNQDIGVVDSSGNIVVGVNRDGVGNISGNKVSSPIGYMQDFFNKLKSNFPDRHDLGGGFLPVYIITFMLALILFRFLSH